MAFIQQPSPLAMSDSASPNSLSSSTTPLSQRQTPISTWDHLTSRRSRKQLSLFFAGATFLCFSTIVTRRALHRRYLATRPAFYRPSNAPPIAPVNGAMEAIQALNIATLNVASFMMTLAGGTLWAFDISNIDDLRRKVRGGLGVDGTGRTEGDVEEEFEEWLATVLDRKKKKEEERERRGEREKEWKNERGKGR